MRVWAVTALLLFSAVACNKSPPAPRKEPAPTVSPAASVAAPTASAVASAPAAPREASVPVTVAQVNATPCTRDADCGVDPAPCQSGCGHGPVNVGSPLFGAYMEALMRNPCCKPDANCPRTMCVQTLTLPVCRKGRCELVAR